MCNVHEHKLLIPFQQVGCTIAAARHIVPMLPPPRRGRAAAGPLPSLRHRHRSPLSFHPLMPAAGAASELSVGRSSAASSGPIAPAIAKHRPARSSKPQPRSSRHSAAVAGLSQRCTAPALQHRSTASTLHRSRAILPDHCWTPRQRRAPTSLHQHSSPLPACPLHQHSIAQHQRGNSTAARLVSTAA